MKKLKFLLVIAIFFGLNIPIFAQKYDPAVYQANGQYRKSEFQQRLVSQKNEMRFSFFDLNKKIYPRIEFEGSSVFTSNIGLWGLFSFSPPVAKPEWSKKGYPNEDRFHFSLNAGLSYDMILSECQIIKMISGIGGTFDKFWIGPLVGVTLESQSWEFYSMVVYSLFSSYDEKYFKNYDPNSFYKIFISYRLTPDFKIGIVSERFYGSGIFTEYDSGLNAHQSFKGLKFRLMGGYDFEFKSSVTSIGMIVGL